MNENAQSLPKQHRDRGTPLSLSVLSGKNFAEITENCGLKIITIIIVITTTKTSTGQDADTAASGLTLFSEPRTAGGTAPSPAGAGAELRKIG